MDVMNGYVLGIDLGGTKIAAAISDMQGNIIFKDTIETESDKGKEVVFQNIVSLVNEVIKNSGKNLVEIVSIGIGSPGPLNIEEGLILNAANLPFKEFPLVNRLKEIFKKDIYLENDANVAALAEYKFGAGKGTKNMIYITVSTGVGAGAIIDGKLYNGSTFNSLEIGHTIVQPIDGALCGCGSYGCLEAYASGTAIARIAREGLEAGAESSLKDYEKVTSYEVYLESEKGDEIANEILDYAFTYLGVGVGNAIVTFDPEAIVIGGGVSKMGDRMFNKVRETVNERYLKVLVENCKIVPAELKEDTGVVGAIALAILRCEEK